MTYKLTVFCDGVLMSGWGQLPLNEAIDTKDRLRDELLENGTGDPLLLTDDSMQTIIRHREGVCDYNTNMVIEKE